MISFVAATRSGRVSPVQTTILLSSPPPPSPPPPSSDPPLQAARPRRARTAANAIARRVEVNIRCSFAQADPLVTPVVALAWPYASSPRRTPVRAAPETTYAHLSRI